MSENLRKLIGLAVMALIVVLGLLIPGEEQVNSFQRNSAVSSVSGQPISLPTAPTADKASAVQAKIESQVAKISDITAEIAALMKEMQALEPPQPPGEDATEDEDKEYKELLQAFQDKVAELNKKLNSLEGKLAKAQAVLNKLNNADLPQAQREDAKALQERADKSQEALEKQIETTGSSLKDRRDLGTKAAIETVELRREDVNAFADCVTKRIGRIRLESHTRNAISGCLQEAPKSPKLGIEID